MMLGTRLDEVAECLGFEQKDSHQAMADIEMTEMVFPHLLDRADTKGLDVTNLMIHREWLVRKGVAQPEYVPPGGRVQIVP